MNESSASRKAALRAKKHFTLTELAEIMNGDDSDDDYFDLPEEGNEESLESQSGEYGVEINIELPDPDLNDVEDIGLQIRKPAENLPADSEINDPADIDQSYVVLATGNDIAICDNVQFEFLDEANTQNVSYTEKRNIQWRRGTKLFETNEIPFCSNEFSEINTELTPLQIFDKYFPLEFFEKAAFFTNVYAEQSNVRGYKPTNADEVRKLFGLHIFMGCLKFPRSRMYWNSNIGMDSVINCMTSDRFHQLRNNLHFVNNLDTTNNGTDTFYKVRPIIESVRNRCLEHPLEENVSIDEQMIPFRGKFHAKQYVKGKRYPWGLKNFVLCGKSGLPYDFFIYQGKSTEISETDSKKFGFGAAAVLHLSKRITSAGHKLYFDNYFSSYQVFEILRMRNINAIGTIRINRFTNPPLIDLTERGSSDEVHSRDKKVVIVKWQDNKPVHASSNFIGIGTEGTVKRWDKLQKKYVTIKQPEIIGLYNTNMGGVDFLDQLISYYRVFIKSKKWTLRVVAHFIDFAVCATWIEYRSYQQKAGIAKKNIPDLLNFRLQLANSLMVTSTNTIRKRGRPALTEIDDSPSNAKKQRVEVRPLRDLQYDQVGHFAEHNQKPLPLRCKMPKCTSKSHFFCTKCKVHLCLNKERNCFMKFHKK